MGLPVAHPGPCEEGAPDVQPEGAGVRGWPAGSVRPGSDGASPIKITVDIYGHLVPGANKAAVDRLDDPSACNLPATAPV